MGYVTTFDFLSNFFCLTVPKCFVVEPLCAVFQRISDIDKLHGQEGGIKISRGSFLPHSAQSFRRGKPLLFHYGRVSKKFG